MINGGIVLPGMQYHNVTCTHGEIIGRSDSLPVSFDALLTPMPKKGIVDLIEVEDRPFKT